MMTPPLAGVSLSSDEVQKIAYVAVGLVVFLIFLIAARFLPRFADAQLRKRHLPTHMVVLGRRVITILVLTIGILAALSFAIQSANAALVGILLATVVAAFGVQDLLRDYVSGYYVLLERHIRPGDRITMEGAGSGQVLDIKLRVTLLQTESGDLIVVPNSELFNKAVEVHARAVERVAEAKVEEAKAAGSEAKPEPPK
jgi:small-conductance mechanosensitive channel